MPVKFLPEKLIPLMLRLPAPLHEAIKTLAQQERRSLNSQLIILLAEAVALHLAKRQ